MKTEEDDRLLPWVVETNWVIASGSLQDSFIVETSDYTSDSDIASRKDSPFLKPHGPESGPCEITVTFEKKYDVGQVYVRSTARVYEVYYANSAYSSSEYLCTVRCGVAEREGKVLRAPDESSSITDGENSTTSEEDWIKINANGTSHWQDIYEATAQISGSVPCTSLTIRLLSLEDRRHVFVDEVYIYLTPVDLAGTGNAQLPDGGSTESSLLSMFFPAMLQLSKSGVTRIQDKNPSPLESNQMESPRGCRRAIDENHVDEQFSTLNEQNVGSDELQQPSEACKCECLELNDLRVSHLEQTLEKLISQVNRVEDICLRFEEKMLRPIQSIEARLERIEDKFEELSKNHPNSGTRISAPAFSSINSNSSSFRSKQHGDHQCRMPVVIAASDANFNPGLIVTAPEFSCVEDEESSDRMPLEEEEEDSCIMKTKKVMSVDEALAAALDGFLLSSRVQPSSELLSGESGVENQPHEQNESSVVADQRLRGGGQDVEATAVDDCPRKKSIESASAEEAPQTDCFYVSPKSDDSSGRENDDHGLHFLTCLDEKNAGEDGFYEGDPVQTRRILNREEAAILSKNEDSKCCGCTDDVLKLFESSSDLSFPIPRASIEEILSGLATELINGESIAEKRCEHVGNGDLPSGFEDSAIVTDADASSPAPKPISNKLPVFGTAFSVPRSLQPPATLIIKSCRKEELRTRYASDY
ncbi:hypothetical protein M569_08469 [Genlisea aurea]|uniref:Uncharacterized protein n=1 Tax=Genlisea aurea TaxID=192259 RepID=S8E1X9_9LAMI|nr:hypothetical protein M569_08469 [Genlisea aurea]